MAAAGTSCSRRCASFSYCVFTRRSITTNSGMMINITHASWKRVPNTTSTTNSEITAPMPLSRRLSRQPGSRCRRWCLVMPACDRVKPTNTPMA